MTKALVSEVKTLSMLMIMMKITKTYYCLFKNLLEINIKYEEDKILPENTRRWFGPVDDLLKRANLKI